MKTYIYILIDPRENKKVYIGKANNPKKRYHCHITDDRHDSYKLRWIRGLEKLGLKPKLEILCKVNMKFWTMAERDWIRRYKEMNYDLVNTTYGGDGMSYCTKETSKKLSDSRRGPKNHNYGKPMSEETKRKMIATKKSQPTPQACLDALARARASDKFKQSVKSKERIAKTAAGNMKKVLKLNLKNEIITEYNSVNQAAEKNNICASGISSVCKGRYKTCGGFKWRFKNQ